MEPSGSPDPEHPPPPKRSPWKHPSSSTPNGGTIDARPTPPAVIDSTSWPPLSEAAKAPNIKPSSTTTTTESSSSSSSPSSAVANSSKHAHASSSHHARHKPARRGDHSPRDHHADRTNTAAWDHANAAGGRGGQRAHNNGGGGRRGSASGGGFGGGRRRGGFDGFYRGPPIGIGPYMRGSPPPPPPMAVAPPFMGPPPPPISPMRPFAGPVVFHEMPSPVSPASPMYYVGPPPPPEALRGLPFPPTMVAPPPYPYYHPSPDPEPEPEPEPDTNPQDHRANLLKQIEFYFSKDNLCTDVYLRRNMDEQGWVDIALIAGFKKVQESTDDLQYVKDTIQSSSILEMQGDKIRRQNDWNKWVIPRESNHDMLASSSAAPKPNINNLTARLEGMCLQESAASSSSMVDENHHEVLPNGPTSSNNQAPVVEDGAGKL